MTIAGKYDIYTVNGLPFFTLSKNDFYRQEVSAWYERQTNLSLMLSIKIQLPEFLFPNYIIFTLYSSN